MGFYPHDKPPEYAYTTRFTVVGHDSTGKAYANTMYPGLGSAAGHGITIKALINLQALIESARAAELAFLSYAGIDLTNPVAGDIFRNINKILNSKQTFERGLNFMKQLADLDNNKNRDKDKDSIHTYRDISSIFETYLTGKLKEINGNSIIRMSPEQIKQKINDIIGDALIDTYKNARDFYDAKGNRRLLMGNKYSGKMAPNTEAGEKEAVQAITDMINIIQELKRSGVFKDYGHLFNIGEKDLKDTIAEVQSTGKLPKTQPKAASGKYNETQMVSNYQGNILELITSTVAAAIGNINISNPGITITGQHTGQMNQMKADSVLLVGKGKIDLNKYFGPYMDDVKDARKSGLTSKRAQNIYAIEQFLNRLDENIDHVIMISDKNVSITADYGGFKAQDRTKLKNIGQMLGEFGYGSSVELINYLANCGASMVQGDYNNEIKTELQTMVGYFLFDHLEVHIGVKASGPNVVNLLNVGGMYIPLSAYLEGIYNGIQGLAKDPNGLVRVNITLGGKTEENVWTEGTWKSFRESRENQSYISYVVMKNIADFISNL